MVVGFDSEKHTEWRRRLERFQRSKLSIVAFCQAEGVSTPSFYQWRKRLSELSPERDNGHGDSPGFAVVRVVGSANVAVQLPGGTRVEIPTTDAQTLRVVLDVLARIDAERAGVSAC